LEVRLNPLNQAFFVGLTIFLMVDLSLPLRRLKRRVLSFAEDYTTSAGVLL